jgi:hypothetical protein
MKIIMIYYTLRDRRGSNECNAMPAEGSGQRRLSWSGGFREVGSDPCKETFWGLAPANLKFDSGEAVAANLNFTSATSFRKTSCYLY